MELYNSTVFTFAPLVGRVGFPDHSLTMIVKATFDLIPDRVVRPSEQQLFPTAHTVAYFVATDNALVKEWVRQEQQQEAITIHESSSQQQQQPRRHVIYMTDLQPESYLRGNGGDRNGWMEVYLLGARDALVANVRPKQYEGHAGRTSFFANLARHIGFMDDKHFKECVLD